MDDGSVLFNDIDGRDWWQSDILLMEWAGNHYPQYGQLAGWQENEDALLLTKIADAPEGEIIASGVAFCMISH